MHRQIIQFGWIEWLVIGGGVMFLLIVWWIDWMLEEIGFTVAPAPHIGLNEPTSVQALVAAEADKQQEQAGGTKETK